MSALPLPSLNRLQAPATWREIDFISDLHLSAETPRTFQAWEEHMRCTDADAIFILGDLVEAWVGDDGRFEGFDARFTSVWRETAALRPTFFMVGNRDFAIGAEMLADCGVTALPDPSLLLAFGQRGLLVHGDELCLADTEYQQFRKQVRNPLWQQQMLAQPLAVRRHLAAQLREKSEAHQRQLGRGPNEWADVDRGAAVHWLDESGADFLLHGHTHRPGSEELSDGRPRHVLSDWDLDGPGAPRAEVLRWSQRGFERRAPARTTR